VRVATRRTVHASDVTGLIGPLEAIVEYSEVRFDAPFGDEIWSGMTAETADSSSAAVPTASGRLDPADPSASPAEGTR